MLDHVILSDESFAACAARVRLGAGVQAHVPAQVRFVVKFFGALIAFERFAAQMLFHVRLMGLLARESFAAALTLERLLARVECFIVLREIAGLVEHLVARCTA